jgi:ketosteroid isomerase-like protein
MAPDNIAYDGIQGVQKHLEVDFADTTILWSTFSTTIDKIEVSTSGDLAYARGIGRWKIKTPTGIEEIGNKWLDIWKKTDGKWMNTVEIWNSNLP